MPLFGAKKVKDPVCGMEIDPKNAAATAMHNFKTYYFCSSSSRDTFHKEPTKYAK